MSGYKFHLTFGFFTSLLFLAITIQYLHFELLKPDFLFFWLITTLIFSIIPDIDARKSKANIILHALTIISLPLILIPIFPVKTTISIIFTLLILEAYHFIFSKKGKRHRHWSHKISFGIILSSIIFLISNELLLSIFALISFLSHIITDKLLPY